MNAYRPRRFALVAIATAWVMGCGETVTLPATGTIYGDLVYGPGMPAAGVVVLVEGTNSSAVSDGAGRFVIGDIPAVDEGGMGKYYTIRGFGEHAGMSMAFLVDHFKVKGQQAYSIGTVEVRRTGTITGTVLLEGMGDHSGVSVRLEGTSIETMTRANGRFQLDRVPAHEGYGLPCRRDGFGDMKIETIEIDGEQMPIEVLSGRILDLGVSVLHRAP